MLLFPDPRPLVERLGADFFRQAPESPGVYLMRDQAESVLYVGKAKSLRKRLASYRVANPDRLPRRHLRLLRAVARIDLEQCTDESAALARESELLRSLRPRFNRAGTWPGTPRFLGWRLRGTGLEMTISEELLEGWQHHGPMGSSAVWLRAALLRVLWCVVHAELGLEHMPAGWCRCCRSVVATIPRSESSTEGLEQIPSRLDALFAGQGDEFANWIREGTANRARKFELALLEADLETVAQLARPRNCNPDFGSPNP
jgi:predicted GIY-YIG superfamily endonuclease